MKSKRASKKADKAKKKATNRLAKINKKAAALRKKYPNKSHKTIMKEAGASVRSRRSRKK